MLDLIVVDQKYKSVHYNVTPILQVNFVVLNFGLGHK